MIVHAYYEREVDGWYFDMGCDMGERPIELSSKKMKILVPGSVTKADVDVRIGQTVVGEATIIDIVPIRYIGPSK